MQDAAASPTYAFARMTGKATRGSDQTGIHEVSAPRSALAEAERIAQFGYWDLDLQRKTLFWSSEIYTLFEIDPSTFEASYEAFLDAIHPEDREYVDNAYTESVKKRIPYNIVHRLQMKDGRIKYVRERCETFYDQAGQPVRSIGTVQNITEPQLTLAALHASETRLRALFEEADERARKLAQAERVANLGSWEVDLAADRLTYSDEALRIHGLAREAFDGTRSAAINLAHPDDRLRVTEAFNATLYDGKPFDIEYRIVRPDGSVRTVHVVDEIVRDAAGRPVRAFGITQDLTDRKRAETKFRDLLEAAPDAMIIGNREGIIELVNAQAERLFGYSRSELLGQSIEMLLPARFLSIHPGQHRQYFDEPGVRSMGRSAELFGQRKNGEEFPVEISLAPLETEHGILVSSAIRDITERKLAEQQLRRFRLAMDATDDSIYLTDPRTMRFVDVNEAACRRLGYAREQLLTMGPQDVLDNHRAELRAEYERVIAAGDAGIVSENTYLTSDGHRRWTELYRRAFEMEGGRLIVTVGRDVTERKEAEAKIARLNRLYAVLSGINSTIVRVQDAAELYREACRILVDSGKLVLAYICVIDPVDRCLKLVASAGGDAATFLAGAQDRMSLRDGEPAGYGPPALAVRERRPIVANDIADDARIREQAAHAARGVRSAAALPIEVGRAPVAVLGLHAAEAGFFDEQQLRLLAELAGDIGFALDHLEKAKRLNHLAYYDQLTGLANRRLFLERLAQTLISAGQAGGKVALLLLDLERLAAINESHGRQAGDALVTQLAERLMRLADATEVSRVSANHFAVLFRSVKGRSEVARRSDRLWQQCFGEPFRIANSDLRSSARGGVALFPAAADAETLLQNAESALRRAKQTGERLVFHAQEMTVRTVEELSLENRLRTALDRREFLLHYQPTVDLDTGAIVGVEALMRWQNPESGLVPPLKFIPLMERTGLILDAGDWALSQAVADHKRWLDLGLRAPRVAVNVSAVQLRKSDYIAALTERLRAGAAPAGIDLEITESVVMEDVQGIIEKLAAARALGVNIAIDDFGTGYSSLSYLAKLPAQALKIDRSFISGMLADPSTMTLVQTMISLAHSLRLRVIAEGVESEEQARTLRLLRCDEMQGYLFSKPLPFEDMTRLLAARP